MSVIPSTGTTIVDNQLPTELSIDGPTHGRVGEPLTYYFLLTGQERWGFSLYIDWGDGTNTGWIGPYPSGMTVERTHAWYESGNYTIDAWARDVYSGYYWATLTVTITENHPPDKPIIAGPLQGIVGKEYNYTIGASDPDGDNVSLYIDWGDGTSTGWTYYFKSGGSFIFSHTWNRMDHFCLRAKAKDIYGAESDWSDIPIRISQSSQQSSNNQNLLGNLLLQQMVRTNK